MSLDEDEFTRLKRLLINIPGVVGVGRRVRCGSYILVIMLERDDEGVKSRVREVLNSTPHIFEVTGRFKVVKE